jgi:hypothetical protein
LLNCVIAAGVLPGISEATLIVIDFSVAALEIELPTTAIRLVTVTAATAAAMRVDFIVLTPS